MYTITARNVNEALQIGVQAVASVGINQKSRNGNVISFPTPVSTQYNNPSEKVLFSEERDANPFFHFFESLWMLAGRDDLAFVQQFNQRMGEFSDDGVVLNGSAYGRRWRAWFNRSTHSNGIDQLSAIIELIKENPENRRLVLTMWDAGDDLLNQTSKDLPCNLQVIFRPIGKQLNMTVFNRSNDMIWGAYGANAVQFATLLEYVAGMTGLEVGTYHQVANNFHVYSDNPVWEKCSVLRPGAACPYELGQVTPQRLIDDAETFDQELGYFLENPDTVDIRFLNTILEDTGRGLFLAWKLYKRDRLQDAIDCLKLHCKATDWQRAGIEWLQRREAKRASK